MKTLQDVWSQISASLGLEIVAPFKLTIGSAYMEADVLVKNFGGENGMLLVNDYSKLKGLASALPNLGYGYSVLSPYPDAQLVDLDATKEMLADWTWSGPLTDRPAWLVGLMLVDGAEIDDSEF